MRGFEKVGSYSSVRIPTRSTKYSAGYDFYVPESENNEITIPAGKSVLIKTGVTAKMNPDDVLIMNIRSSMALKHQLMLGNGCGIIDADYYPNEIGLIILNTSDKDYTLHAGDKIAQGVFLGYRIIDDESEIESTRNGGFGSTGK